MKKKHFRKNGSKKMILLASLLLMLATAIGGTLAYLISDSSQVTNSFIAGEVSCEVQDNYSVKNNGNIPAYIRAVVVVNWVENDKVLATAPKGAIYTIIPGDGWVEKNDDGIYYYSQAVLPGDSTTAFTVEHEGAAPQIQILAEAIQTEPGDVPWDANGYTGS